MAVKISSAGRSAPQTELLGKSRPSKRRSNQIRSGTVRIAPGGHQLTGPTLGGSYPTFLYLPKEEAEQLRMSLVTQSHMWNRPDDPGFTELPIVRASEFRDKTIDLVGVRWIVSRGALSFDDLDARVARQNGRERVARLLAGA